MKYNLDQIRAANAFQYHDVEIGGKSEGEVVKKLPPLIRCNGFLGALAFALEKRDKDYKNDGYYKAFEAILNHLKSDGIRKSNASTPEGLLTELTKSDSAKLRDVTSDSLLYLKYLRRFAKKPTKNTAGERG